MELATSVQTCVVNCPSKIESSSICTDVECINPMLKKNSYGTTHKCVNPSVCVVPDWIIKNDWCEPATCIIG